MTRVSRIFSHQLAHLLSLVALLSGVWLASHLPRFWDGRLLGRSAFILYATTFSVLILARPVIVTGLALSNAGTLPLNQSVAVGLSMVLGVPVIYLIYSVKKFFGFRRAFGIDHFDSTARSLPMVREGIFRFSQNAMYVYGFLLLWIPAIFFRSTAAVIVALFSHCYIWVHYVVTEKPDMQAIYGSSAD